MRGEGGGGRGGEGGEGSTDPGDGTLMEVDTTQSVHHCDVPWGTVSCQEFHLFIYPFILLTYLFICTVF